VLCREELGDSGFVRDYVVQVRDGREGGVCGDQRADVHGRRGKYGLEGSELVWTLEERKATPEMVCGHRQKGREQLDVGSPQRGRVRPVPSSRTDVDELLDRLDCRRRRPGRLPRPS
jgi:hypothetical protein